jgi:methylphosphotriester-DNA--protein-cysteine methyltransferase
MQSATNHAIHHIRQRWREGKTLKEVALMYHVDAGNLDREFKRRAKMTFVAFMDGRRKAHVLKALKGPRVFGYELGDQLGFPSALAFYRWVGRAFGVGFLRLRQSRLTRKRDLFPLKEMG